MRAADSRLPASKSARSSVLMRSSRWPLRGPRGPPVGHASRPGRGRPHRAARSRPARPATRCPRMGRPSALPRRLLGRTAWRSGIPARSASSSVRKPWAHPGGTYTALRRVAESSSASQASWVGDPARRSTTTSNTVPDRQRTSLASSCGGTCRCSPRRVQATGVERDACFGNGQLQPALGEPDGVERTGEETAIVPCGLGLDLEDPGDGLLVQDHGSTSSRGTGITNRQPHSRTSAICPVISARRFHGRISR